MSSPSVHLQSILHRRLSSPRIVETLQGITKGGLVPDPEIKSYHDAVYFNYYSLGLCLQYAPQSGYKPKTGLRLEDLDKNNLALDSIIIYNVPQAPNAAKKARSSDGFSTFVALPLPITLAADDEGDADSAAKGLTITTATTGKDFVSAMGEPERKGGGAGPSNGSIGIWIEWQKHGIMVEFGGDQARGPQAWEKGKDATWKTVTLFKSGLLEVLDD